MSAHAGLVRAAGVPVLVVARSITIELELSGLSAYVCTALVGRQSGLSLSARGQPQWHQSEAKCAVQLWVSPANGELQVARLFDAVPVSLRRSGRIHDLEVGCEMVVRDLDQILIGGRMIRVALMGDASAPAPPECYFRERPGEICDISDPTEPPTAERERPPAEEATIDDELAALKKKMGLT